MTPQDIQQKLNDFFVNRLEYDANLLTAEAELKRDLGMTSLDAVETSLFIRRTFGFQPERGAIKGLLTLQDLYEYIEKNV
ncbi:MAG: acyl carrier protein [Paludibacteraceae bacterium]|nr:acyl carrier protein [Paludibacteraceae bacterium]